MVITKHPGEAATGAAKARAVRWSLAALFLGAFAVGTDGFMIAGLLPRIAADFATSTSTAAQLVTAFSVGYAVGAPVLSSLFDRLDRRTLLVGALVILAAANAAAALTPTLWFLFVVRVLAALAAGTYSPTAAVVAARLVSVQRRGRALAVITAGLTMSIVAGVPLGNVVGERFDWRATFAAVAVIAALVAVGLRVLPPRIAAGPATSLRQRMLALRRPGVPRVLATTVLGIFAGYLGYTYVTPLSRAVGVRGGSLAIVLVCFGVGAAIGSSLSGVGVDRHGQPKVVQAGALTQAVALAALAIAATGVVTGLASAAAAFGVLGVGSWSYNAPQQHRLVELVPESATVVVALNSSAIYAGIGLSGAVGAVTTAVSPILTCTAGALLALGTAALAGRRRTTDAPGRS